MVSLGQQQNQFRDLSTAKYKVIAMGQTGAGKSTVLNTLALGLHSQQEKIFKEGAGFMSETAACQSRIGHFKRIQENPIFQFMDTPGFMDSEDNDLENIVKVCDALDQIQEGINVILFCFPATRMRLAADLQTSLRWLGMIFGKGVYKHVKICITQSDILSEEERKRALQKAQTELLPTIKKLVQIDVNEQMIIYKHGQQQDGLDEILQDLELNQQETYIPEINRVIVEEFDRNNPYESANNILTKCQQMQEFQKDLQTQREKSEENQRKFEQLLVRQGEITQKQMEEQRLQRQEFMQERQKNQEQVQNLITSQAQQMKEMQRVQQEQVEIMSSNFKEQFEGQRQMQLQQLKQMEHMLQTQQQSTNAQIQASRQQHEQLMKQMANMKPTVVYQKEKSGCNIQ